MRYAEYYDNDDDNNYSSSKNGQHVQKKVEHRDTVKGRGVGRTRTVTAKKEKYTKIKCSLAKSSWPDVHI